MVKNFMDLSGKVAVVMGGTSGIGAMMALGLAEAGADVVPTGRRQAELDAVCDKIEALGRKTVRQTCDVQSRESIDSLREAVLGSLGRVDILLNAAGITFRKPTKDVAEADWNRLMDINVTGTLRACQSFYEPLKASGAGRVVNIASLSSHVGLLEVTAYGTSKAAVLQLTRQLAVDYPTQIRVNCVCPGTVDSPFVEGYLEKYHKHEKEKVRAELNQRQPIGRLGKPEEIANLALYLASDEAGFVNGSVVSIDGGWTAA